MTVPVTKRYAKMKDGDLKVKPPKKSGWWYEQEGNVYFYVENDTLAKKLGTRSLFLNTTMLMFVKRSVHSRKNPDVLSTISYNIRYDMYPRYNQLDGYVRSRITETEYNRVLIDCTALVDGRPVFRWKNESGRSASLYVSNKFIRHDTCPAWATLMELDALPLGKAA
jgi:hypothetical protein